MHLKRSQTEKFIPIKRKGTKYIAVALHNKKNAIPLILLLREYLKIVKNRDEARKALLSGEILVNNKEIKSEKFPLTLFDVLEFRNGKKSYRLIISKTKKFELQEIPATEKLKKICKVIGKKKMKKGMQINFSDGRNILSDEKIKPGDSAVLNTEKNKIEKVLELKSKAKVLIISGKHTGEEGEIKEIGGNSAEIIIRKKAVNIKINDLMIIENGK